MSLHLVSNIADEVQLERISAEARKLMLMNASRELFHGCRASLVVLREVHKVFPIETIHSTIRILEDAILASGEHP